MSSVRTMPSCVLAVSVYNHYKRILSGQESQCRAAKVQRTACLARPVPAKPCWPRRLRKMLNVPFAIADATTLTEAGYVGEDVENILLKLIQAADFDIAQSRSWYYLCG